MPTDDPITSEANDANLSREAYLDHLIAFTKQNAGDTEAKRKAEQRAYYAANREKMIASQKAYHKRNPHKQREFELRRLYGLNPDEVEAMMASQDFRCLICKTRFGSGRQLEPNIDHCHKTGKIRGILCGGCNRGLGHLCDSVKILRAAIRYLKEHQVDDTTNTIDTH